MYKPNKFLAALLAMGSFGGFAAQREIVDAAKDQDAAAVRALLKQHADVNARQGDGATALHWAAHWNDLETAGLFIQAGAQVNASDDSGATPLSLACANGTVPMTELLLKAGANPNAALSTGDTPLMAAARTGSVDVLKLLLAHGANVNAKETSGGQTALMWAVAENHLEVTRLLLKSGADVHATSKGKFTALLFAAQQGNIESARALLAAGADVNEAAPDGVAGDTNAQSFTKSGTEASALLVAIDSAPETEAAQRIRRGDIGPIDSTLDNMHQAHEQFAVFLLEKGADPTLHGAGRTALHSAVQRVMPNLVKALLAHGADPNARLEKPMPAVSRLGVPIELGATPFWLAASYANVEIMTILVAGGADPNLTSKDGTTPLMVAAGLNFEEGMDKYGRRWFAQGTQALQQHAREAVLLCLELGNDINAANEKGFTAMFAGVYWNGPTFAQFLYDHGAKVNAKNKRGQTPWSIAQGEYHAGSFMIHKDTSDLLEKFGADTHLGVLDPEVIRRERQAKLNASGERSSQ
jgi:ankyrin repeat protein